MAMNRANFADELAPGFRQIFVDALKFGEKPSVIDSIFNMPKTPSTQYVDDSYVTGFGLVPTKDEGASVTYDEICQGNDTRYTHDTYSLAYRVTKEMYEDGRYGTMGKLPKALGRSMRATIETSGANVFNNGFSSSYLMTGGDGKELFATDHPLVTGGTQKNELTTAADLSETSYEQALIDIYETTDDRGILMNLTPKKLLYPVEMDFTVQKMFKSTLEYDTANNSVNPMKGDIELMKWAYLTDSDAWFIICDEHELNWFWRVRPDHYKGNDFDTDDAKFKVRARWSRGWSIPWGLFGSPGA